MIFKYVRGLLKYSHFNDEINDYCYTIRKSKKKQGSGIEVYHLLHVMCNRFFVLRMKLIHTHQRKLVYGGVKPSKIIKLVVYCIKL